MDISSYVDSNQLTRLVLGRLKCIGASTPVQIHIWLLGKGVKTPLADIVDLFNMLQGRGFTSLVEGQLSDRPVEVKYFNITASGVNALRSSDLDKQHVAV